MAFVFQIAIKEKQPILSLQLKLTPFHHETEVWILVEGGAP